MRGGIDKEMEEYEDEEMGDEMFEDGGGEGDDGHVFER